MATDSLFDEMEPRILRPALFSQGMQMQAQVSEPSLFQCDPSSPFKENFTGSVKTQQTPVTDPVFGQPLVLPSGENCVLRENISKCNCKSKYIVQCEDPTLKCMIENQNKQLVMLQNQIEQLISYQEQLKKKLDDRETEKCHEATQTTFVDAPAHPKTVTKFHTPPKQSLASHLQHDRTEITLTFRDLQLETIMEQPPSPQPSIVVNMQEYPESISDKTDESQTYACVNVMEQVQKLLAQTKISDVKPAEQLVENIVPYNHSENVTRKITMQRVRELGVSFIAAPTGVRTFPDSNYRFETPNKVETHWEPKETDQSVEIQHLVEKYLGHHNTHQWLPDYRTENARSVEMSMSTQQYLEKYGLMEEAQLKSSSAKLDNMNFGRRTKNDKLFGNNFMPRRTVNPYLDKHSNPLGCSNKAKFT